MQRLANTTLTAEKEYAINFVVEVLHKFAL